jgi:uncharacterized protein YqhQ
MAVTLKEKIKEQLLEHTLALVVTPALVLGGTTVWVLMPTLLSPLWTRVSAPTLQRILGLAFLSVVVLLAYVLVLRHKLANSLKAVFGLFWDRSGNPYCPSCQNLLTNYGLHGYKAQKPTHFCLRCKNTVAIRDDNGKFIPFDIAKAKVLETR